MARCQSVGSFPGGISMSRKPDRIQPSTPIRMISSFHKAKICSSVRSSPRPSNSPAPITPCTMWTNSSYGTGALEPFADVSITCAGVTVFWSTTNRLIVERSTGYHTTSAVERSGLVSFGQNSEKPYQTPSMRYRRKLGPPAMSGAPSCPW